MIQLMLSTLITAGMKGANICQCCQLSFPALAKKIFIQLHGLKVAFEERKKYEVVFVLKFYNNFRLLGI